MNSGDLDLERDLVFDLEPDRDLEECLDKLLLDLDLEPLEATEGQRECPLEDCLSSSPSDLGVLLPSGDCELLRLFGEADPLLLDDLDLDDLSTFFLLDFE